MLELAVWQQRFRQYLEVRNFAARTVEAYVQELRPFLKSLEAQQVTSLANLTRAQLEQYRTEIFYAKKRDQQALSVRTQIGKLGAVRQFVRFLVREDYLLSDVSVGFEMPKTPEILPRTILSEAETLRLLEAPSLSVPLGIRDRAILEVLYATAIRNSELCDLKLDSLDNARHLVRVDLGKGGKDRVVPLGEEAELWIDEYLREVRPQLERKSSPWLFLTWRGQKFGRTSLAGVVLRWAKRAGLAKHATPHVLRHSCATHMLRRGASLRHLQALLGHATPNTTQRYTRVEISDLRKVLRRCHPRERRS